MSAHIISRIGSVVVECPIEFIDELRLERECADQLMQERDPLNWLMRRLARRTFPDGQSSSFHRFSLALSSAAADLVLVYAD
jgi:hypothetical protein